MRAPTEPRKLDAEHELRWQDQREEQPLGVVRDDVIAPVEQRPGAAGALRARGCRAPRLPSRRSRRSRVAAYELDDPAAQDLVDEDVLGGTRSSRISSIETDRLETPRAGARNAGRSRRAAPPRRPDSRAPVRSEKRSSCASGSGNGALVLDRVLGRDARGTGRAARRVTPSTVTCCSAIASSSADCVFGMRAVDLVDEDDVREDRPGPELEVARLLVVDGEAGRRPSAAGRACTGSGDVVAPEIVRAIERARDVLAVPARPRAARGRRTSSPPGRA